MTEQQQTENHYERQRRLCREREAVLTAKFWATLTTLAIKRGHTVQLGHRERTGTPYLAGIDGAHPQVTVGRWGTHGGSGFTAREPSTLTLYADIGVFARNKIRGKKAEGGIPDAAKVLDAVMALRERDRQTQAWPLPRSTKTPNTSAFTSRA